MNTMRLKFETIFFIFQPAIKGGIITEAGIFMKIIISLLVFLQEKIVLIFFYDVYKHIWMKSSEKILNLLTFS